MAVVIEKARIELQVQFTVSESEARALDALAGYGDDEFVKAFYNLLGKAYMQPHEAGLRSFLSSIRTSMPELLQKASQAREVFTRKAGE